MSEIPVRSRPRKLVDWINPTGARKVHSLIDKVYQRKNLEMAWEMVKANRRCGWAESGRIRGATRSAVGSIAARTEGRCLPASTGAASADPEGRQAWRVSHVGNSYDLRQGMPAGAAQPVGANLRPGVR